jgi:chromosome segregation ATPase
MRTGEKTIAQLQAEIESLRAERDSLRAQLQAEAAARAGVEGERDDGRARADEAVGSLDQLADLLADSVELPIGQTDAVERLNEIIDQLASRRKGVRDGD